MVGPPSPWDLTLVRSKVVESPYVRKGVDDVEKVGMFLEMAMTEMRMPSKGRLPIARARLEVTIHALGHGLVRSEYGLPFHQSLDPSHQLDWVNRTMGVMVVDQDEHPPTHQLHQHHPSLCLFHFLQLAS